MKNLSKGFILLGLAVTVFGGGGLATYLLFVKKPDTHHSVSSQLVVTPALDQGISMLRHANQQLAKGEKSNAQQTLISLIQNFPGSSKSEEAKRLLGNINIQAFFSLEFGFDRMEYTVSRGDSIAKIASKTKASPELIFKTNELNSLAIHIGQKLIIPMGRFSFFIDLKHQDVTLLNNGTFFRWCKPEEFKLTPKAVAGYFKVYEKIAWAAGRRVAFGDKNYFGSSRWIILNQSDVMLFSETNPQNPNIQKPNFGIMLAASDMEEIFTLITKDTSVIIQ